MDNGSTLNRKRLTQKRVDYMREHQRIRYGYSRVSDYKITCACGLIFTALGINQHRPHCQPYKAAHKPYDGASKECSKCRKILPVDKFWSCKSHKSGFAARCAECSSTDSKIKYAVNRDIEKIKSKIYRIKNAETISARRKERYREMVSLDPEKYRSIRRRYWREKLSKNIPFRLLASARNRLYEVLARTRRPERTVDLIGCSPAELKIYLEKQFAEGWTWDNWGTEFEIDHIMPCSSFDLTAPDQRRACFHFSNLRPISKLENRKKWNKVIAQPNDQASNYNPGRNRPG